MPPASRSRSARAAEPGPPTGSTMSLKRPSGRPGSSGRVRHEPLETRRQLGTLQPVARRSSAQPDGLTAGGHRRGPTDVPPPSLLGVTSPLQVRQLDLVDGRTDGPQATRGRAVEEADDVHVALEPGRHLIGTADDAARARRGPRAAHPASTGGSSTRSTRLDVGELLHQFDGCPRESRRQGRGRRAPTRRGAPLPLRPQPPAGPRRRCAVPRRGGGPVPRPQAHPPGRCSRERWPTRGAAGGRYRAPVRRPAQAGCLPDGAAAAAFLAGCRARQSPSAGRLMPRGISGSGRTAEPLVSSALTTLALVGTSLPATSSPTPRDDPPRDARDPPRWPLDRARLPAAVQARAWRVSPTASNARRWVSQVGATTTSAPAWTWALMRPRAPAASRTCNGSNQRSSPALGRTGMRSTPCEPASSRQRRGGVLSASPARPGPAPPATSTPGR